MKTSILCLLCASIVFFACGQKNSNDSVIATSTNSDASINDAEVNKEGKFSINGKAYIGKVTVQTFSGVPNFSVLCQFDGENSDFVLLQTTFVSESEARANKKMELYPSSMLPMTDPKPGVVTVSLSGVGENLGDEEFTGSEKATGIIQVANNILTIKDLKLLTKSGQMKTVNASIDFGK